MSTDHPDTDAETLAPHWVVTGGMLLAGSAGFVNTIMLSFFHLPVSHMSGSVSKIGIDLVNGNADDLQAFLGIVGGFLIGAFLSGVIIGNRNLRPGRRYGHSLLIQGTLLMIATFLAQYGYLIAVPLAATACGMQNAMASSYRGLTLRTTHISGVVTDFGIHLGHLVRERRVRDPWKLVLLAGLLGAFFTGGALGMLGIRESGLGMLYLAAFGNLGLQAGCASRLRRRSACGGWP